MFLPYILLTLFLAEWATGETCPTKYLRYSQEHSFCLEPNPTCDIKVSGLYNPKKDIHRILKWHNAHRSKVALGEEGEAGGLPTASNMMKLTWDTELAEIAQKWAENCKFAHDCNYCRLVENFPVGQNMAFLEYPCPEGECSDERNGKNPEWERVIDMFYNEIENFDQNDIENYDFLNYARMSQFTQMIWANTWRVGCGFVAYQNNTHMRNTYVCNYGPTGNIQNSPIYIPGPPCSNCPINSCCGEECQMEERFGGLCKMRNTKEAPIYPSEIEGALFSCNFMEGDADCARETEGVQPELKSTLMGNILYMQLNGGEQTELIFDNTITSETNLCLRLTYRKGPIEYGQTDVSSLTLSVTPKGGYPLELSMDYSFPHTYTPMVYDIPKVEGMKFSVKFSVPEGASEHILEIKEVSAVRGNCNRG